MKKLYWVHLKLEMAYLMKAKNKKEAEKAAKEEAIRDLQGSKIIEETRSRMEVISSHVVKQ